VDYSRAVPSIEGGIPNPKIEAKPAAKSTLEVPHIVSCEGALGARIPRVCCTGNRLY